MVFQYKCVDHIFRITITCKMTAFRIVDGIPEDMDHYGLILSPHALSRLTTNQASNLRDWPIFLWMY
jgi:hypothetical protein